MKDILLELIKGFFGLFKQWWFTLAVILIIGLATGLLDGKLIMALADKATAIIEKWRGP